MCGVDVVTVYAPQYCVLFHNMPDTDLSLGFKVLFIAVPESEKLQHSPLQLSHGIGSVAVSYILAAPLGIKIIYLDIHEIILYC